MPLNIRNEEVNQLASRAKTSKTEAVKRALENEPRRLDTVIPLRERLRPLQNRILARPATGLDAAKRFYDELSASP
jgi:antitoxin VapB